MVVGDVTTAVDVLILGAGPGGYVAAIRAAQLGRKVTLIDAGAPGGTCLNAGCIPLKALLSASERYAQARGDDLAAMGISNERVTFDWSKMQAWKQSVVQRLSEGVRRLLAGNGVECVHGTGWFINDQEVRVEGEHGSLRYKFDACIIATGAAPAPVEALAFNGTTVLTPEQALALPDLPETLNISGDNYIALELATLFARLGVKIKLHAPGAQLLPGVDPAALRLVQAGMRKQGISVSTNMAAEKIEERPLVVARPATPRVSGLRLDAAGVQLHVDGGILVDNQQRTSQPRIFAVGDCTGGSSQLASWAIKQGKVAAEVIAGQRVQFAPLVTPLVVHTTPEIAIASLPAVEGEPGISGRFPLAANGRALTLGSDSGLTLLSASPDGTLLHATLVGPRAGDLIGQLALALEMGATLTDLSEMLYAHPGLSETIQEAADQTHGRAIHIVNRA
ncbi:MAG TPA: FAD-dependent oxidoreductase [Ktedonobacteraceae bacterium]